VALALVLATAVAYGSVRRHAFVNYDDPDYVIENRHVTGGLTVAGLRWALTSTDEGNWFPLTWLSHMADVELYGLASGGHHVTSLLLHLATSALLFFLLRTTTATRWPSALAASLFALHPLRVESVAWVAERKDVLNGLFWVLTLAAWVRYTSRQTAGRYVAVCLAFALGLMTKGMIVTLPAVLLLLDVWPLGRMSRATLAARLLEKAPLLAIAAGPAVVTFVAQSGAGAVSSFDTVPFTTRLANAIVSAAAYLGDMVWPAGLAVFYPHPLSVPAWHVVAAASVLAALSYLAWRHRATRPYLLVGWLWYLVTLLPVIGLIQIGAQARADRYTYIPSIGVALMVAFGLGELCRRVPRRKPLAAMGATAGVAILAVLTWQQVQHWRDSAALFRHALAVTAGNYVAHNNLGLALREQGRLDEARVQYEQAIRIQPRNAAAHNNLGEVLLELGRQADALAPLEQARRLQPGFREAEVNLGSALAGTGRLEEAVAHFRDVVRRWPGAIQARSGLGIALVTQGHVEQGIAELQEAVRLDPGYADGHYNLGLALAGIGRADEAERAFTAVVRLEPDSPAAHFGLGNARAAQGRLAEAADAYSTAIRLRPDYATAHGNLGAALAGLGRLDEAIAAFEEALRIDPGLVEVRSNLERAIALRRTGGGL
jgi:tetratricopeptide (TPR) repeat protein